MKICDSWLREWVGHGLAPEELARRLTMLGLEVDAIETAGTASPQLLVGMVTGKERHPGADRLSLCRVDVGGTDELPVVCGAPNVRAGGRYVVALPGARLPGDLVIRATKIRGEASAGMLCSATELGLESSSAGLLDLDADAVPGADAVALLALGDPVLDINVTPNRADCFSIAGIAREVAAVTRTALRGVDCSPVAARLGDAFAVTLQDPADCPRFVARVIRGLDPAARTPLWMAERLRRCGVRPIHPVVDVTNYVMLELGQPMHAYDLARLQGSIEVRRARADESLQLLDGQTVRPDASVLVIADQSGPVGIAGIMGGERTAVAATSTDILLESAWFSPGVISGRARQLGLHTDASTRFERGVDPGLQALAVERATRLIVAIAGGMPGPTVDTVVAGHLPMRRPVRLRRARAAKLLGTAVPDAEVGTILEHLQMRVESDAEGWQVTPPGARFDIEREEDLIEEVARVYGYDRIPETPGAAQLRPVATGEWSDAPGTARATLVARGYQEAITYSFVEPRFARELGAVADCAALALSNPISTDLATMRQSLWPGLLTAMRENRRRQHERVRLFEIGTCFVPDAAAGHREEQRVAAVACGSRLPEQWGAAREPVDFFDLKADLTALLALAGSPDAFSFRAVRHPALHPGRCAEVRAAGEGIGWMGELHPAIAAEHDLAGALMFEIRMAPVLARVRTGSKSLSRFPAVRRDLALVVPREIAAATVLEAVRRHAPPILQNAFVFDIYTGAQIGSGEKSVAIGLILQDTSRTLTDADADSALNEARAALAKELGARFRE